jgi:hypothetical protein
MRTCARIALIAISLALVGCSVDGGSSAPQPELSVDLSINGGGIRITRVYPASEFPIARFKNPASSLRYELRDPAGQLVVSGEVPDWRMAYTEDAIDGSMQRTDSRFEFGAGSIRLPPVAGTLVLREKATGRELGRADFDPITTTRGAIGSVHLGVASDDDILGDAVLFDGDLDTDAAVDLLFLGEGFTEDEMEAFEGHAHDMFNAFIALDFYGFFGARFNGWTQRVRSREEGIDDPMNGVEKDTAFDFGFGDTCMWFNSSEGMDLVKRLQAEAGADVVVVIVNTPEGRGCTSNGVFTVALVERAPSTISHELGHILFGLADEYEGGTPPCAHDSDAPNVTNHGTREGVPWPDLVTATEFPTPAGSAGVGAFEGAGYCPEGMYRPENTCLMREHFVPFCAVCAREVNRYFENFGTPSGPQDDCPPAWRDDGICDLCLGDDPDCAAEVCDYDGECDVEDGEDCGDCEADCGKCSTVGGCGWWELFVCNIQGNCDEKCPVSQGCGDGTCAGGETDSNCGEDCGCAELGQCDGVAPYGCWCDPSCGDYGDCCSDIDVCGF